MEFVFLSGYIPLRDMIRSGRFLSREYYRLSHICFRLFKETVKTKNGKDLSYLHRYITESSAASDVYKRQGQGTYYLREDVEAYDFIFDGPKDRRIRREIQSDIRITKRFQRIDDIYAKLGITENRNEFNGCRYIDSFIQRGKYGIRMITSLITRCHVKAKEVYDEIQTVNTHMNLNMSLGIVLSWAVEFNFNGQGILSIVLNKIDTEK